MKTRQKQKSILILGDNIESRQSISKGLNSKFIIRTGDNVSTALDIIQDSGIDILLVNFDTPGVDLMTLCHSIKKNKTTHHIGVIIISRTINLEHQIDLYNCDIDAIFPYPINIRLLEGLINNLLRKSSLHSAILNNEDSSHIYVPLKKHLACNDTLITKAAGIIETNLKNSVFDFDHFALEMRISKSTLYRKITELTDLTPRLFIINARLKHALGLLINTSDSITNIAHAVGYNDPKYFSKSFKTKYGKTPREYRKVYCEINNNVEHVEEY
jgi:AraC-type DNA-binding domain-containing proteins